VQRARNLLLLNLGRSPKKVLESLGVSNPPVFKLRNGYIETELEGLYDAPLLRQLIKLDKKNSEPFSATQCRRLRVAPPIGAFD
jgi:hypothetical protein